MAGEESSREATTTTLRNVFGNAFSFFILLLIGVLAFLIRLFSALSIFARGDMMAYQPYAMGMMKCIWGDDAGEYKPDRWLNKDGVFQQESPFKFTAFQAGPWICIGREFAYRQMKIFSTVLLGSFSFKLADENKPVNY